MLARPGPAATKQQVWIESTIIDGLVNSASTDPATLSTVRSCRSGLRPKTKHMTTTHPTRRFRSLVLLAAILLISSACAPAQRTHSALARPPAAPSTTPPGSQRSDTSISVSRLAWPLTDGYISSEFGNQRRKHRHLGIDIRVPTGTQIRAAAAGRVTFSGKMRGYGNVIFIDHGDGLETRYAHNRTNKVRTGASVAGGTPIAEAGSTGNASAPHLHFEVRKDGRAKDPLGFLSASSMPFRR